MVLAHHKDADLRLRIQTLDAQQHIIPFVEEWLPIGPSTTVLEVGCGEGGVLLAFLERGAQGVGVEISEGRYRLAQTYLHPFLAQNQALLLREDIYQVSPDQLPYRFDLIILKDVIEHIPQPERLLNHLRRFLKERGLYIYRISTLANAIWGSSAGMSLQASEFFSLSSPFASLHLQMDFTHGRRGPVPHSRTT
jgi:cyclopropane fatty-acyl-phospholipid synthase-like methyltransferase